MALSPIVTSLPEYVDQNKLGLIQKSVFGAPSVKYLNIQSGVKHAAALNLLATDATLQANTCGWNEAGTATISQRILEVGNYKVNMAFCDKNLLEKFANREVMVAAGAEVLPYEEEFVSDVIASVNRQIESLIWNAEKATDGWDGLLTIAKAEGTDVASAGSTMYDKTKDVYVGIPVEVLDKAVIFMGIDNFRALALELTEKSLFHYDPKVEADMAIILPGTNTKVVAVAGLNGTDAIVAADPMNLFYGVDMRDDAETFDFWYSKDNREFRLAIGFNAGTQIAFPDQVVYTA